MGFVSKTEVEEILSNKENGTFILRFSDSELGGVSIAYVGDENNVIMVAPFSREDLSQRCIADVIFDLEKTDNNEKYLTCVYSKPEPVPLMSFRKYRTSIRSINEGGYAGHTLRVCVPTISAEVSKHYPKHYSSEDPITLKPLPFDDKKENREIEC